MGDMLGSKGHDMRHADTKLAACVAYPPMNKGVPDIPTAL